MFSLNGNPTPCPLCGRYLRHADPGGTVDVPPENPWGKPAGHYAACSYCQAKLCPDSPAAQWVREVLGPEED
jgi:hypothetical protein